MTEGLQVRVVRTVVGVAPRRLTATDITEAVRQDGGDGFKGDSVYATLTVLSKNGTSPLSKERKNGVYHYGVAPDFDIDAWIRSKTQRPGSAAASGEKTEAPLRSSIDAGYAAEVIRVLRTFQKRATADELEGAGEFLDPKLMRLTLGHMCADGGPLERERGVNGGPFEYGIRRGFDTNAWLRALLEDVRTDLASEAAGSTARVVRGAASLEDDTSKKPSAAQKPEAARPGSDTSLSARPSALAAAPSTNAAPSAAADSVAATKPLNGEAHALAVELVVIAAANVITAIRKFTDDPSEDLRAAVLNFERADRIYVTTKVGARA